MRRWDNNPLQRYGRGGVEERKGGLKERKKKRVL